MKHFLLKTIFALLLLTQVDSSFAYIVKGTVVDATGKPVHKCSLWDETKLTKWLSA